MNFENISPLDLPNHSSFHRYKVEEDYRTLVENIPIGLYRNSPGPRGKFLMANPTFLKMFGFEDENQLKEVDVADLYVEPAEREAFSEHLLARGSVAGLELRLKKRDGTPLWGAVTARVIYESGSEEVAFLTVPSRTFPNASE